MSSTSQLAQDLWAPGHVRSVRWVRNVTWTEPRPKLWSPNKRRPVGWFISGSFHFSFGYGSKLNHQGTTGFGLGFHLPGFPKRVAIFDPQPFVAAYQPSLIFLLAADSNNVMAQGKPNGSVCLEGIRPATCFIQPETAHPKKKRAVTTVTCLFEAKALHSFWTPAPALVQAQCSKAFLSHVESRAIWSTRGLRSIFIS